MATISEIRGAADLIPSPGTIPVAKWSFQACVIQGGQQIYLVMLWYWGFRVRNVQSAGALVSKTLNQDLLTTKIALPIAILMWINGIALLLGLPQYFWQDPPRIPSFYRSIICRKTILVSVLPPPDRMHEMLACIIQI